MRMRPDPTTKSATPGPRDGMPSGRFLESSRSIAARYSSVMAAGPAAFFALFGAAVVNNGRGIEGAAVLKRFGESTDHAAWPADRPSQIGRFCSGIAKGSGKQGDRQHP